VIVVDTNILAYLYLPGDRTAHAEALLERDSEWAAPVLWRSEFRNILAGYIRRRSITFDQACGLQDEAESLLAEAEFEVDSSAVLKLVRDSDCSAYDCEFVALAIRLNTKLVTADKKLLQGFPTRTVALAGLDYLSVGIGRPFNSSSADETRPRSKPLRSRCPA
jgi:predicted nucleic acid-binding protein